MYISGARRSKISQIIGATILGKTFKCIFVDGRGEEDAGAHWAMTPLATLESAGIAHN